MGFFSFLTDLFIHPALPESVDYIVVGLGNPGAEYIRTRHNVGFRVAEFLAKQLGSAVTGKINEAEFICGILHTGKRVLVAKPRTFMNRSGIAVEALVKRLNVPLSSILVCVDDFNIPLGAVRIRRGGSHGGHNGLKSIAAQVGSDFPRIRIGIGPLPQGADIISFVLGEFSGEENATLEKVVPRAADAAKLFMSDGIDIAMNHFNK